MSTINLIPAQRRASRGSRRRMVRWGAGVGAYALALAGVCTFVRSAADRPSETHEAEMRQAADRIEQSTAGAKQSAKEIARLKRQLDAAMTVARHPDWSMLLGAVARARGEEVVLDGVEVSVVKAEAQPASAVAPKDAGAAKDKPKGESAARSAGAGYQLRLSGYARAAGEVFVFAHNLEMFGALESVTIARTQPTRVGSMDLTAFELTAMLTDRPVQATGGETHK